MKGTAYLFQSSLIILWWVLISVNEEFYRLFSFSEITKQSYFALLAPDLLLLGILSLVRTYKTSRDLSLIILGAFAYATLFCINAALLGGDGIIPTITMMFGLAFNIYLCYPGFFARSSASKSFYINFFKTVIQILSFWTLFLGIIPYLILYVSTSEIGLSENSLVLISGFFLFLVFSLLGLSSAYSMVQKGNGTPLPIDATNSLVTSGPYAYLRNPMAVAGVGQLLAIALLFNSFHIAVFAIIGGLAWHFIVRPIEEDDLQEKFGSDYSEYKSKIKCWIPKFKT